MSEEIRVTSTWEATDVVEIPEGMTIVEAEEIVASGEFPDWLAGGIDSVGASLVDWRVGG